MKTAREDIERGLRTYQELVEQSAALRAELDESRAHYFAAGQAERADRALYVAKRNGRDRVELAVECLGRLSA